MHLFVTWYVVACHTWVVERSWVPNMKMVQRLVQSCFVVVEAHCGQTGLRNQSFSLKNLYSPGQRTQQSWLAVIQAYTISHDIKMEDNKQHYMLIQSLNMSPATTLLFYMRSQNLSSFHCALSVVTNELSTRSYSRIDDYDKMVINIFASCKKCNKLIEKKKNKYLYP